MGQTMKPKLDDKSIATLARVYQSGVEPSIAIKAASISPADFYDYRKRGYKDRDDGNASVYTRMLDALDLAEASRVEKWAGMIAKAAEKGDWRAAAWLLERCYPHHYGKPESRPLPPPPKKQTSHQLQGWATMGNVERMQAIKKTLNWDVS